MAVNQKNIQVINYKDVLKKIEHKENHLLIGNGFNYGLGINTGYWAIFQKMISNDKGIYKDALSIVEESGFDLELFIGKLENDINEDNIFLKKYIQNKVKFDFMKATHEIVKSEIKNIYAEKNEGIFLLLKNFTNYFTLNYDSFLYLFLLKHKTTENDKNNTIVLHPNIKFIEDDLNKQENNIYAEIKSARKNGILRIDLGENNLMEKSFNRLTKSHFSAEVKEYSKTNKKGWKGKDIDRVINLIIEEEKTNQILETIDDGSRQLKLFNNPTEYVFENKITQNLFFLHGAFHIYKDGKQYKKITQKSDKALYDRLENILNNDNQDIVCIFENNNKEEIIKDNVYLKNCLNKLVTLSGNLVIIGSALSENDNHIFENINNSNIEIVYISILKKQEEKMREIANSIFPEKEVYFFDAETISYEMPKEEESDN